MTEAEIQAETMRALGSRSDCRVFRNVTAQGWAGPLLERFPDGSVLIGNARPLHAGLFKGSGDVIGWASEIIGPSHVGQRIARFLSVEVKTPTGVSSEEQRNWLRLVRRFGGNAMIATSADYAVQHLHDNPTGLETL